LKLEEVVRRLSASVRRHPRTPLPGFDDAGGVEIDGRYILVKVDGFAASRALYPWCTPEDFGFRAVTAAVSDVIAKGCEPYIYAVSIGVRPGEEDAVELITRGVEEAVRLYGGYVENFDTNIGEDVWVDVFVLAECSSRPIPRSSRVGDFAIVPRSVGLSFVAFSEYSRGRRPTYSEVREFSCRPRALPLLTRFSNEFRGCISGSIDISDTLYESLAQISEPGGVLIDRRALGALHPLVSFYVSQNGVSPEVVLLASNEEYIPIYSVKNPCIEDALGALRSMRLNPHIVGVFVEMPGVFFEGAQVKKISWDYTSGTIVL